MPGQGPVRRGRPRPPPGPPHTPPPRSRPPPPPPDCPLPTTANNSVITDFFPPTAGDSANLLIKDPITMGSVWTDYNRSRNTAVLILEDSCLGASGRPWSRFESGHESQCLSVPPAVTHIKEQTGKLLTSLHFVLFWFYFIFIF